MEITNKLAHTHSLTRTFGAHHRAFYRTFERLFSLAKTAMTADDDVAGAIN